MISENKESFSQSLVMLDKINECSFLTDECQMMLSPLTRKFNIFKLKIKNKN